MEESVHYPSGFEILCTVNIGIYGKSPTYSFNGKNVLLLSTSEFKETHLTSWVLLHSFWVMIQTLEEWQISQGVPNSSSFERTWIKSSYPWIIRLFLHSTRYFQYSGSFTIQVVWKWIVLLSWTNLIRKQRQHVNLVLDAWIQVRLSYICE